jgi:hypothetical protein
VTEISPLPQATGPEASDPFQITTGVVAGPKRIGLYGEGGAGKTRLAAKAPNPVFLDLDGGSTEIDIARIANIADWSQLVALLRNGQLSSFRTIVIDTLTKGERLARQHLIAGGHKGKTITTIEEVGGGYGKGYVSLVEMMEELMSALETHVIGQGQNVIVIMHDTYGKNRDQVGEEYQQHMPALYHGPTQSVRNRWIEWFSTVAFLSKDIMTQDKQAVINPDSRTVYVDGTGGYYAKCRMDNIPPSIVVPKGQDGGLWSMLGLQ